MRICFIVTTYNVLPYIEKCLGSLSACTQPGDRVIIVDDGSTDGTQYRLSQIISKCQFGPNVIVEPILLGVNTPGGVGIPANVGLGEALQNRDCDCVFFVDGDDWLLAEGFFECRRRFQMSKPDILIANYAEFDQSRNSFRKPADVSLWAEVLRFRDVGFHSHRSMSLRMISVPWRKFYSSNFLRKHSLRYPEGDYFFEDNPFHWKVCLKAEKIVFEDRELCVHRINRPGQTMASTGGELIAFFDHYDTILDIIEKFGGSEQADLRLEALKWMLTNMNWHLDRLQSSACWAYSSRAAAALGQCTEKVWCEGISRFAGQSLYELASALRRGDVSGVATYLAQRASFLDCSERINALEEKTEQLLRLTGSVESSMNMQRELLRFKALTEYGTRGKAGQ